MFDRNHIIRKRDRPLTPVLSKDDSDSQFHQRNKQQINAMVRVTRLWHVPDRTNLDNPYSIDMILQDEKASSAAADLSYPLELDYILERKLLFKVFVKSENIAKQKEVYNVMKICDDADLIKKFDPPPSKEKSTDPDFNNEGAAVGDKEFTDSMADTDDISPTKTPAKRTRLDNRSSIIEVADDNNAQLSSNKVKRVIKKEKK